MKNMRVFIGNWQFLLVKILIYLNRRILVYLMYIVYVDEQIMFRSDCTDAQAALALRCSHMT